MKLAETIELVKLQIRHIDRLISCLNRRQMLYLHLESLLPNSLVYTNLVEISREIYLATGTI